MIIVVSALKEACTGMEGFLEKQVGTAQIGLAALSAGLRFGFCWLLLLCLLHQRLAYP